jgi:hypothetical protein
MIGKNNIKAGILMKKLTHEDAKRIAENYYYKLGTHDINVINEIYTPDLRL